MTVACQVLLTEIEKVAPRYVAEEWDNVGLQLGDPARSISRVLLTLDCTPEVVQEAIDAKADLIVAHHPLIFKPLKQVRFDLPGQALVAQLLRHDIMFYAAHTNLDSSRLGSSGLLADKLGLVNQGFLEDGYRAPMYKVAVFVPTEHSLQVRTAMAQAGAGRIGDFYSECFFQTAGTGTFRPLTGANPFIGTIGELANVAETKLETVVSEHSLARVLKAMLKAHPYEVPAYDVIPTQAAGAEFGIGKVGKLSSELTLGELAQQVKDALGGCPLRVVGDLAKIIKKAAICAGSGGSFVPKAIFKGADVLIAGDIGHHDALDALAGGLTIIDPGHYATEWLMLENLQVYLNHAMKVEKKAVELVLSKVKTEPFNFI
ncbi:MAG: Nif3-like dinuclear metal center hexameric protein [Peptococcaceae bacterium]|nr:Nif3-like dinuclear metal center hexameric protein [Peptococcaceae bacterium]